MKTKIATVLIATLAVISLCLAQTSPKPDKTPTATLQEIHADLKKTQAELQRALALITALEQRVSSLEQANAKLQQEVKSFGQPRLTPLERK